MNLFVLFELTVCSPAGVYAFKCNEAEELFNVVKVATENSCNTPEISLIDQINSQSARGSQSADCHVHSASNNGLNPSIGPASADCQSSPTGQVNQFNHLNQMHQLSQLNNNQMPPKLPASHFYANDIRQYMNLNVFDNGYINKDNSPLLKQDFDFSETVNLNYAKLDDLQLHFTNLNNNHQSADGRLASADQTSKDVVDYQNNVPIMCQTNPLIGSNDSIVLEAIRSGKKGFRPADLDHHQLNYTTLALDCKGKSSPVGAEEPIDTGRISTPVTPVHKSMKNNDFRTTSEPTSPASPNKQENIQQYSTIDFTKTKALNQTTISLRATE